MVCPGLWFALPTRSYLTVVHLTACGSFGAGEFSAVHAAEDRDVRCICAGPQTIGGIKAPFEAFFVAFRSRIFRYLALRNESGGARWMEFEFCGQPMTGCPVPPQYIDDGTPALAQLKGVSGIAVTSSGDRTYFTEEWEGRIRVSSQFGVVTLFGFPASVTYRPRNDSDHSFSINQTSQKKLHPIHCCISYAQSAYTVSTPQKVNRTHNTTTHQLRVMIVIVIVIVIHTWQTNSWI